MNNRTSIDPQLLQLASSCIKGISEVSPDQLNTLIAALRSEHSEDRRLALVVNHNLLYHGGRSIWPSQELMAAHRDAIIYAAQLEPEMLEQAISTLPNFNLEQEHRNWLRTVAGRAESIRFSCWEVLTEGFRPGPGTLTACLLANLRNGDVVTPEEGAIDGLFALLESPSREERLLALCFLEGALALEDLSAVLQGDRKGRLLAEYEACLNDPGLDALEIGIRGLVLMPVNQDTATMIRRAIEDHPGAMERPSISSHVETYAELLSEAGNPDATEASRGHRTKVADDATRVADSSDGGGASCDAGVGPYKELTRNEKNQTAREGARGDGVESLRGKSIKSFGTFRNKVAELEPAHPALTGGREALERLADELGQGTPWRNSAG